MAAAISGVVTTAARGRPLPMPCTRGKTGGGTLCEPVRCAQHACAHSLLHCPSSFPLHRTSVHDPSPIPLKPRYVISLALAMVTISGMTPWFWKPQYAVPVRPKPVCTSSAMQMPPASLIICMTTKTAGVSGLRGYGLGGVQAADQRRVLGPCMGCHASAPCLAHIFKPRAKELKATRSTLLQLALRKPRR